MDKFNLDRIYKYISNFVFMINKDIEIIGFFDFFFMNLYFKLVMLKLIN